MADVPKRAIPQAELGNRFDYAVKENIEIITGQRGTPIAVLATTATTAEIITKINLIIRTMQ